MCDNPDQPNLDEIHLDDEDADHVLSRHRSGAQWPKRTEFPPDWSDEKITSTVLDVARNPDQLPTQRDNSGLWMVHGVRDDVTVRTIVQPDGSIVSGYPLEDSPGVVRNPKLGGSSHE